MVDLSLGIVRYRKHEWVACAGLFSISVAGAAFLFSVAVLFEPFLFSTTGIMPERICGCGSRITIKQGDLTYMRLLETLEAIILRKKTLPKEVRIDLKEIVCKKKKKNLVETFRTAAVGSAYSNPDGSSRQEAMQKVKEGDKVRLIWAQGESGGKDVVYLVKGGIGRELNMSNCFGRLDDKTAASVVRWLTQENISTAAKVHKVTGGTAKRPKLGCVVELETYRMPEVK
jgi:hypothetical protein